MKQKLKQHSVMSVSSLLLFFLFVLFLLPMLIESAQAYRINVQGQERNNNLYTASAYITTKFRQFDWSGGKITLEPFVSGSDEADAAESFPALCFISDKNGSTYCTYLYLYEGQLKELYTQMGSMADAAMGTTIAVLSGFEVEIDENGLYYFKLTDPEGISSVFCLHGGLPS